MEEEHIKQIGELRARINKPDLVINRVPEKELEWFKNWCNQEFCGDYGMGLKALCIGLIPSENEEILQRLTQLEDEVKTLKYSLNNNTTESEKLIKLGNGNIIKKR